MGESDEIIFETLGALGRVTLNRPQAHNALTLDKVRRFQAQLARWAGDEAVAAVLVEGSGGRAFCAGGDLRAIWESCRGDGQLARDFFREEYRLNRAIFTFPKPYIALMSGIVMGGGVGISVHGSHRVVSDRTLFAMPETGIGLFPDVGGSYFLPRLPGRLGLYLGLTGRRITAADCCSCGIATHFIRAEHLGELDRALAEVVSGPVPGAMAERILDLFAADPGPSELAEERSLIDRCFAGESLAAIRAALRAEGGDWAGRTLETLESRSPTSLAITMRQLERGAGLDFDQALVMEFRLALACLGGHDFLEGIRAAVIEKDGRPQWRPARFEEVDPAAVEAHFAQQDAPDLTFESA